MSDFYVTGLTGRQPLVRVHRWIVTGVKNKTEAKRRIQRSIHSLDAWSGEMVRSLTAESVDDTPTELLEGVERV